MSTDVCESIQLVLTEGLNPLRMVAKDDSVHHQKHAEARKQGGGHYQLFIVSERFQDLSLKDRHRLVYDMILDKNRSLPIHALSLKAMTPSEWSQIEKKGGLNDL